MEGYARASKRWQITQTETALCLRPLQQNVFKIGTKIQDAFDKGDNKNGLLSELAGEVTDLEELSSAMREARDDHEAKNTGEKDAVIDAERKKEAAGMRMCDADLSTAGNRRDNLKMAAILTTQCRR